MTRDQFFTEFVDATYPALMTFLLRRVGDRAAAEDFAQVAYEAAYRHATFDPPGPMPSASCAAGRAGWSRMAGVASRGVRSRCRPTCPTTEPAKPSGARCARAGEGRGGPAAGALPRDRGPSHGRHGPRPDRGRLEADYSDRLQPLPPGQVSVARSSGREGRRLIAMPNGQPGLTGRASPPPRSARQP